MIRSYNPPTKYNPVGEAKAREIRRQAYSEVDEKNKGIPPFMFKGYGFRPQYHATSGALYMEGPLCPRDDIKKQPCFTVLSGEVSENKVSCDVCDFTGVLPYPLQRFREIAQKKYEGHLRYIESGKEIQTLDVPYEAIKANGKDETREIKIKWSQKDGRNMAVIYFFENSKNGEKSQIMVDMDREEIRHDATDIRPGKILARVQAEFPKTNVEISYNEEEKNK